MDDLYAPSVIQEFPQFTVMEEPIGSDSLVVQVTPTRQDLLEPVSYTHLDVYKRQSLSRAITWRAREQMRSERMGLRL